MTDYSSHADQLKQLGTAVIRAEAEAVASLENVIDEHFVNACQMILNCDGRIVVTGMGKSGHVGNKISATLASTGTPAFFMHPGEASHGDLGMLLPNDVVLALSNSGSTQEIAALLPMIKRMKAKVIAITGNDQSLLAQASDVHITVKVDKEACPLGLAPTSSTTAALAMGDALAIALLEVRGFTEADFAISHPGGALGKRLLLTVNDIMHTGNNIPRVNDTATIRDALLEMSKKGLGMTAIENNAGELVGLFTDGDLRRALDSTAECRTTPITELMTKNPKTCHQDMMAVDVLNLMQQHEINGFMVVDEQHKVIGALNMIDMLKSGVM
ncbi:MAG: KpsF/GutQ family sugar-phosphate isomerase [Methylococcales bacterium]|jgi:arabinose-5-phosphate isomerase|nr:KpsF/GutQ family sugar-phosphate isomerase [Methylococcales bacterium]MBT7445143.1 KpsF/GutQ family sugar-phosphate isomerase [Methylococcales bacterium]